ncbi:MAG: HAD-IB family hydrolase, partial [Duncaniella sp.]|nr:HAD-IB family hydrolase [Duncaniella sp.]
MSEKKIALFDFDGTLCKGDSFIGFALYSVGPMRFATALLRSFGALAAWKLGIGSNSKAKETLFGALYKGRSLAWLEEKGRGYASRLSAKEKAGTVAKLREHLSEGHEVLIVTASIPAWVSPWASKFGNVRVLGTIPEVDSEGRLTGRFATPNCHGAEKIKRVREAIPDFDSAESWGYGDSAGDDEMLEAVTHE